MRKRLCLEWTASGLFGLFPDANYSDQCKRLGGLNRHNAPRKRGDTLQERYPMLGQMMQMPLTIGSLSDHAARFHSAGEIVSVETSGGIEHTTWGQVGANARRLASALGKLGLEHGARCGTIA